MIQFFTNILDGKITNTKAVRDAFASLKDGRYQGVIKPYKIRSSNQNRYYWKCIVPMVKDGLREAGYNEVRTDEDAHRIMKHLFLKKIVVNEKTGEIFTIEGSTSELSTIEFVDFIESVIQWGIEYLNITIPYPSEQLELIK